MSAGTSELKFQILVAESAADGLSETDIST